MSVLERTSHLTVQEGKTTGDAPKKLPNPLLFFPSLTVPPAAPPPPLSRSPLYLCPPVPALVATLAPPGVPCPPAALPDGVDGAPGDASPVAPERAET